jgi:hypothetical protein
VFEQAYQVGKEFGSGGPVEHAVVDGQSEFHPGGRGQLSDDLAYLLRYDVQYRIFCALIGRAFLSPPRRASR